MFPVYIIPIVIAYHKTDFHNKEITKVQIGL